MTLESRVTALAQAIGADIKALQAGGPGGSSTPPLTGTFPGISSSMVGSARYYPATNRTATKINMSVGLPSTSATTVTLKKNGTAVGSCTASASSNLATPTVISVAVLTTDYLTLDLTSAGAGDIVVRVDF